MSTLHPLQWMVMLSSQTERQCFLINLSSIFYLLRKQNWDSKQVNKTTLFIQYLINNTQYIMPVHHGIEPQNIVFQI